MAGRPLQLDRPAVDDERGRATAVASERQRRRIAAGTPRPVAVRVLDGGHDRLIGL